MINGCEVKLGGEKLAVFDFFKYGFLVWFILLNLDVSLTSGYVYGDRLFPRTPEDESYQLYRPGSAFSVHCLIVSGTDSVQTFMFCF